MFTAKKFDALLGTPGLSDALLNNHFSLYEGYVKNTNLLSEKISAIEKEDARSTPEYAELKRRFGWEYNGMRLHELYFENLANGGVKHDPESALCKALALEWGSCVEWAKDFKATGAMRGIGWVVLAHDPLSGALYNVWVNEHDSGHLVGATPILVMDVFEHAFVLDYGMKRAEYIETFWRSVDWGVVASRFK